MEKCKRADFVELSEGIIDTGACLRFRAGGGSMHPFIRNGDFLVIRPIENSSVKIGDVALYFTAENKVIVHRVIKKYKKDGRMTLAIKGDASFGSPEKVDIQNVLGRVVAIERNGREIRLDTRPYRIIGLFFAVISPFSQWTYPIGRRVKQGGRMVLGGLLEKLQSPKLYCIFAKKLIRKNIHYQIASSEEAAYFYRLYNDERFCEIENPIHASKEQADNPEPSGFWIIAKRKDKVVGGANLCEFQESDDPYSGWWIFGMKVNWRYRRTGIGKILLKMAEEVVAREKASEIKLLVFKDARPANNLYRKMGFRPVSIPELDKQLEEEAKKTLRRRIILAKDIKSE